MNKIIEILYGALEIIVVGLCLSLMASIMYMALFMDLGQ
jgi:hypothetical protein